MMKTTLACALAAGTLVPSLASAQSDTERAYGAELLADAGARVSMQGPAGAAGWEKGKFFISDATGDNTLAVGGSIQFRYEANFRQDRPPPDEDFTHGFENRRTRMRASGNLVSKALTYKVEIDFSRNGGGATLLDAEGKYTWDNKVAVRWGQFKAPLMREELVSDWYQLGVERSIYNTIFTLARVQGVEVSRQGESVRFAAMINDGTGTINTPFNSTAEADYGLTGRVEWMWAGNNWKRFDDFTSWADEETYAGLGGVAVHYQSGGETGGPTADMDSLTITGDVSVEGKGWNVFASAAYRHAETAGAPDLDVWGLLVQGGIFVADQWELFARYDVVVPDTDAGNDEPFHTVCAGFTYYVSPKSHAAKLTCDLLYYINDQATSSSVVSVNSGSNLLADTEGDQFGVRVNFQILF